MSTSTKTPDSAHAPLPKKKVLQERYRIVRQLGRGGMGAVYEAVDQRLGITVALKETLSTDESSRKQFEQEAKLLACMQHPALPRVSDHFVEGDRAFLVMQFIAGTDLARIIAQQPGPFPKEQVMTWADQLLDALDYLHTQDRPVIHRDIKPHNLKLTASGQIVLLDFGLAKAQPADTSVTASRAFFGYSKHYAPLEQIQDLRTDQRSDIYALGATLYHLLTGVKPPDAMVRATALVNSEPDPLNPADKINPAVGRETAAILGKAMAQKSEQRFASAKEFREALSQVGRQNGLPRVADNSVARKTAPVITQDLKLPMLESAGFFGPGKITIALLGLLMMGAGIIYASGYWVGPANKLRPNTISASTSVERATSTSRKTDKPRPENTVAPLKKSKPVEPRSDQKVETGTELRKASPVKRTKRPVGAPSIRLPNPEIADHATPAGLLR